MSHATHAPVYLHALGMINALGGNLDTIATALGRNEPGGMGVIDTQAGHVFAGRVCEPLDVAPPASLAAFDCRNNRLLLAALTQIAPQIKAARERYGAGRVGVVLGTSTSGMSAGEAAVREFVRTGAMPESFDYQQMEFGKAAPFAAAVYGLHGPAYTVSTACTSSAKAIVSARRLLRAGLCDAVVTGGVDSLCELTLQGFASLELTSATRTNPMSRNRSGINIGEGAAVFLMSRSEDEGAGGYDGYGEDNESNEDNGKEGDGNSRTGKRIEKNERSGRNGRPVMLAGAGETSDAYHVSSPDPDGVGGELALRGALADAGLSASQIAYVNLHATATQKNDAMEAHLTARVFPAGVAASGTKPLTGHTLGAAGAIELGLAWLCLMRSDVALPRHVWDGARDPALPALDLVEDERYLRHDPHGSMQYIMSNSFAFGGSNASLILGR